MTHCQAPSSGFVMLAMTFAAVALVQRLVGATSYGGAA